MPSIQWHQAPQTSMYNETSTRIVVTASEREGTTNIELGCMAELSAKDRRLLMAYGGEEGVRRYAERVAEVLRDILTGDGRRAFKRELLQDITSLGDSTRIVALPKVRKVV